MQHRAEVPVLSGASLGHSVGGGLPCPSLVGWRRQLAHAHRGTPRGGSTPSGGDSTRGAALPKEYDPEPLKAAFPLLTGCIKPSVDVAQMEGCLRAAMVTETELERAGVLTKALHHEATASG